MKLQRPLLSIHLATSSFFFFSSLLLLATTTKACETDEDCSLNGICAISNNNNNDNTCICDPGWKSSDCGVLDLLPATRWTGYNHTNSSSSSDSSYYYGEYGNSSWGGQILRDRTDPNLFHLIVSQFSHGCGLSSWRPFSKIIRAESRTGGAQGPYVYADDVLPSFRHNPTIIWSPSDQKYLLYTIGAQVPELPGSCGSDKFANNISVSSAADIRGPWSEPVYLVDGTNPAPWPLLDNNDASSSSPSSSSSQIVLAMEDMKILLSPSPSNSSNNDNNNNNSYLGPYLPPSPPSTIPWNTSDYSKTWTEDPFLWRDKRGHWHALVHWMIDITENGEKYPRAGAHLFSRDLEGGVWRFKAAEEEGGGVPAYTTAVEFTTDGEEGEEEEEEEEEEKTVVVDYYRRERPKLFFSDDGEVTPLFLVTGVQEFDAGGRSYTLIQPIGGGGSGSR